RPRSRSGGDRASGGHAAVAALAAGRRLLRRGLRRRLGRGRLVRGRGFRDLCGLRDLGGRRGRARRGLGRRGVGLGRGRLGRRLVRGLRRALGSGGLGLGGRGGLRRGRGRLPRGPLRAPVGGGSVVGRGRVALPLRLGVPAAGQRGGQGVEGRLDVLHALVRRTPVALRGRGCRELRRGGGLPLRLPALSGGCGRRGLLLGGRLVLGRGARGPVGLGLVLDRGPRGLLAGVGLGRGGRDGR